MNWNEKRQIKVAILDLYDGFPNQGMRCIRELLQEWGEYHQIALDCKEFNVRQKNEIPDMSFDVYISTGGPGDPLLSRYDDWDRAWIKWVDSIKRWNENPSRNDKKYVLFICHSFQLACRHFNTGLVCKRKSTSFGVFPVHMLDAGKDEPVFEGLRDPFYAVDSRDHQVIQPNHALINKMGASILCIEKSRPHVPYERAIMAMRFNEYMIGTQFHPEADAAGMSIHLQTEEKRNTVIENHGEAKLRSMLERLEDPNITVWTHAHIIPNFLNHSAARLFPVLV